MDPNKCLRASIIIIIMGKMSINDSYMHTVKYCWSFKIIRITKFYSCLLEFWTKWSPHDIPMDRIESWILHVRRQWLGYHAEGPREWSLTVTQRPDFAFSRSQYADISPTRSKQESNPWPPDEESRNRTRPLFMTVIDPQQFVTFSFLSDLFWLFYSHFKYNEFTPDHQLTW